MVTRTSSASRLVRPVVALLLGLSLAATAACRNQPLTAPSGSAITLVAATNVLPVNGSTEGLAWRHRSACWIASRPACMQADFRAGSRVMAPSATRYQALAG